MLLPAAPTINVESGGCRYYTLRPRRTFNTQPGTTDPKPSNDEYEHVHSIPLRRVPLEAHEHWVLISPRNGGPSRVRRSTTPPPPYTELPSAEQQARQKRAKPGPRAGKSANGKPTRGAPAEGRPATGERFERMKVGMAAFGRSVKRKLKDRVVPEFLIFLGYLAGYDEDGNRLDNHNPMDQRRRPKKERQAERTR